PRGFGSAILLLPTASSPPCCAESERHESRFDCDAQDVMNVETAPPQTIEASSRSIAARSTAYYRAAVRECGGNVTNESRAGPVNDSTFDELTCAGGTSEGSADSRGLGRQRRSTDVPARSTTIWP